MSFIQLYDLKPKHHKDIYIYINKVTVCLFVCLVVCLSENPFSFKISYFCIMSVSNLAAINRDRYRYSVCK